MSLWGAAVDVGFIIDPDGDRLVLAPDGVQVSEEYTLPIVAKYRLGHDRGSVATNLSTSQMIESVVAEHDDTCQTYRAPVGESNVVSLMQNNDCILGGEGNGGIIEPRVGLTRDAMIAMAYVLSYMAEEDLPLSALLSKLPRYAMIKAQVNISKRHIQQTLSAVADVYSKHELNLDDGVRVQLANGWLHVRASNTEPIVRFVAEFGTAAAAQEIIDHSIQIALRSNIE